MSAPAQTTRSHRGRSEGQQSAHHVKILQPRASRRHCPLGGEQSFSSAGRESFAGRERPLQLIDVLAFSEKVGGRPRGFRMTRHDKIIFGNTPLTSSTR